MIRGLRAGEESKPSGWSTWCNQFSSRSCCPSLYLDDSALASPRGDGKCKAYPGRKQRLSAPEFLDLGARQGNAAVSVVFCLGRAMTQRHGAGCRRHVSRFFLANSCIISPENVYGIFSTQRSNRAFSFLMYAHRSVSEHSNLVFGVPAEQLRSTHLSSC
jgi:hypothetical protein